MSKETFKTFKRSARSFEEFALAECFWIDSGLSEKEARDACQKFNSNRSEEEIAKGTKMEYTRE